MNGELNTAIPGGKTAQNLFLLGSASLFVSALFILLNLGSPSSLQFGTDAWIFPAWGFVATLLAFALRKSRFQGFKFIGLIWLALGAALAAMIIFGTTISLN